MSNKNQYKADYSHWIGRPIVGYRNSKALSISHDGKVLIEYEVAPGITKEEIRDLSEVNLATIADRA